MACQLKASTSNSDVEDRTAPLCSFSPNCSSECHSNLTPYCSIIDVDNIDMATTLTVMDNNHPSAKYRAHQRNQIDNQLKHLENTSRLWRKSRNNIAFISQLPIEVLCIIFHMYIAETRVHFRRHGEVYDNCWYSFSHVCSTWRMIAIHNPALWRNIRFDHPDWALEMLRRAARTPLSVCMIPPTVNNQTLHILRRILRQSHSIEELRITTTSTSTMLHILQNAVEPAFALHSLAIAVMRNPRSRHRSTHHTIPSQIFGNDTPNLRRVSLTGCGVDHQSSLLKNLTSLHLSSPSVHSIPLQWCSADLLRTLRYSPLLESLSLIQISPPGEQDLDTESQVPLPVVTLPQLVTLRYFDYTQSMSRVIDNIRIPSKHTMMTWCIDDAGGDFSSFFSSIEHATGQPTPQVLKLSGHGVSAFDQLIVAGHRNDEEHSLDKWKLSFQWRRLPGHLDHARLFRSIAKRIDVSNLQKLSVGDFTQFDLSVWKLFATSDHLEEIILCGYPFKSFIDFLTDESHISPQRSIPFPLPALTILTIEKAVLDKSAKLSLIHCLNTRYQSGLQLQTLYLQLCHGVDNDYSTLLRELIPSVICDKIRKASIDINTVYQRDAGSGIWTDPDHFTYEFRSLRLR